MCDWGECWEHWPYPQFRIWPENHSGTDSPECAWSLGALPRCWWHLLSWWLQALLMSTSLAMMSPLFPTQFPAQNRSRRPSSDPSGCLPDSNRSRWRPRNVWMSGHWDTEWMGRVAVSAYVSDSSGKLQSFLNWFRSRRHWNRWTSLSRTSMFFPQTENRH